MKKPEYGLPNRSEKPLPTRTVIMVCLFGGCLCIISTILKTWFGTPNLLDSLILPAGLVLCGISIFKRFHLGKGGLSASLKDKIVPPEAKPAARIQRTTRRK